jgi:hypothetical protein
MKAPPSTAGLVSPAQYATSNHAKQGIKQTMATGGAAPRQMLNAGTIKGNPKLAQKAGKALNYGPMGSRKK